MLECTGNGIGNAPISLTLLGRYFVKSAYRECLICFLNVLMFNVLTAYYYFSVFAVALLSKQEMGQGVDVLMLVNLKLCSLDVLLNLHILVFNELICICCFSVFAITLECTGNGAGEVGVAMQVNLTLYSAVNQTVLNFKRKKTCLRGKWLYFDFFIFLTFLWDVHQFMKWSTTFR